jgi:hypothetical protein
MSIVRVGLAETKDFSDGWDNIFGGKKKPAKATKASAKKKRKATKKKSK